ncbi:peptidase associated/transthyretin-like domain-containing protein [Salinimicrobium xinjiangense]|uniref:hypothetical protein n=1 Tax=Salinimicrobium xinjiangense TaxID=438596 RepID=UPI0004255C30|nr:hypothetical protein [Salinimicrobium xinjiangense]
MNKLLLSILFISLIVFGARSQERVEISGTIIVPAGYTSSGVHVYNKSSGKGNVSDSKGNFELRVKEGDSVYFTALQFKELLVVIDGGIVEKGRLVVEIFEGVNTLPEVVVRPHDLTGSLDIDAKNIKTEILDLPAMTAFSINDYDWEWRPDGQTAVTNSAMNPGAGMVNGADPLAILSGIIGVILPPKKAKNKPPSPRTQIGLIKLEREIRSRYDDEFFMEQLQIPPSKIADFIAFLENGNFPDDLLNKEREMDLLQLMFNRSEEFLKQ